MSEDDEYVYESESDVKEHEATVAAWEQEQQAKKKQRASEERALQQKQARERRRLFFRWEVQSGAGMVACWGTASYNCHISSKERSSTNVF